jgi:hypothetical protein
VCVIVYRCALEVLRCVLLSTGVLSLKLLRVGVPPYTYQGEKALLHCQYELENDRLYSVTWYKDHEEFYRYVPKSHPPQHSYPLEGIKVDVSPQLFNVSEFNSCKFCAIVSTVHRQSVRGFDLCHNHTSQT